jgi:DNA-binding CsgD family transcriptional regulator
VDEITSSESVKPAAGELAGADFAALIEATYRVGTGDADWLGRIVACAQPVLDRGRGLVGCLFAAGPSGRARVTLAVGVGALPAQPEALAAAYLPALLVRAGSARAGAIRGTTRASGDPLARAVWGIVAVVPDDRLGAGGGCALFAPLPRPQALSRDAAAIWSRIADHLGEALRARQAASHLEAIWLGLLSGRWRLVDHFDVGGWRFVIARGRPRPASPRPVAHLTDRERVACANAAEGRANKVIAADMGVAVSTVGMLLLRATRKLGCHSRAELIRTFRFGEERWHHQDRSARDRRDRRDRHPAARSAAR